MTLAPARRCTVGPALGARLQTALGRWCWWCCLCLGLCLPAQADVLVLRSAQAVVTVDGAVTHHDVELPYHWDRVNRGRAGEVTFTIPFALSHPPTGSFGVYFQRIGSSAEIWLNGSVLARLGDPSQSNQDDYAKGPQYITIPERLLGQENVMRIHIRADGGRYGGLSVVELGPEAQVRPRYASAYQWRVATSAAVAIFSLMVGVGALTLWFTQVDPSKPVLFRRDGIYLVAGLGELFWAVRVGDAALTQPPLAWPWWGGLITVALAGWICCMALFCHRVAGWHLHRSMPWVRGVLGALVGGAFVASALSFALQKPIYLTIWLASANVLFIAYALVYFHAAWRRADRTWLALAFAGVLNVLAGVHDWLAIRISVDYDGNNWIRYSSVLFAMVLWYVVLARFRAASAQSRELMTTLASRVAQREAELKDSYGQLEVLARAQERTDERTRILRDMHDGVGSHISSAIRQLQTGLETNKPSCPAEVLLTLRDAMDQLKLSIDSIHLPPGDVNALLANLRYRLEPRFNAMGIELQWDVDLLTELPRLDVNGMRQLQFMLFEALSNVLQHAHAKALRMAAHVAPGGAVVVQVTDDGHGFDALSPSRKGLLSMHERASAIGAQLRISSQPGCTTVEIALVP
jgi:signal transduction histidine kinase